MVSSSSSSFQGTGITRAHTWGLVVPLLVALSPFWLSKYATIQGLSAPMNALVAGFVVTVITYLVMTHVPLLQEKTNVLAKAVLCGLLIAEILVLKPYGSTPSMGTITLWLFFYYHTMEHA